MKPPRITLVISSLQSGGAERVLSTMANYWAERGFLVSLISLSQKSTDFYRTNLSIQRIELNQSKTSRNIFEAIGANISRLTKLRKAIYQSQPDAVISFTDRINVLTLLSTVGSQIPVIISERNDPTKRPISLIWATLRRLVYKRATTLVMQTPSSAKWAEKIVERNKVSIIPNPVQQAEPGPAHPGNYLLAVGRLVHQKAYDVLIHAFSKISSECPDINLIILGEGTDRPKLVALIKKLRLESRVSLPGVINNVSDYYRGAQAFVLSSRYEGFPNVLLEAMMHGCAVISTDYPTRPQLLKSQINGLLAIPEDPADLSKVMKLLIKNQVLRKKLGACAQETVQYFTVPNIMKKWNEVIEKITSLELNQADNRATEIMGQAPRKE